MDMSMNVICVLVVMYKRICQVLCSPGNHAKEVGFPILVGCCLIGRMTMPQPKPAERARKFPYVYSHIEGRYKAE